MENKPPVRLFWKRLMPNLLNVEEMQNLVVTPAQVNDKIFLFWRENIFLCDTNQFYCFDNIKKKLLNPILENQRVNQAYNGSRS